MVERDEADAAAPGRANARERILDAALAVAEQVGAAHLTLDAVAAEAGVSKGGLLYHFASKDALLTAMVDRQIERYQSELERARRRYPETPGGYVQAHLEAEIEMRRSGFNAPQTIRSFIVAAVNTPELMARPRRLHLEHLDALRANGPRFLDALLISLALDGLFFGEAFEMLALTPDEHQALLDMLRQRAAALDQDASAGRGGSLRG
ncbi:TetR/AcrR family transcriptional regulator [Luteimonas huabeiensis]|uniref:TetR/AcrR family transcriptional regulator n=1 Tax=Luteimonas huabeiensis TaxID=1244513 RepID=UPI0004AE788C|nr:TetR/AcrR family transcriptional regulator [Luteimonas huabeiensis]